MWEIIASQVFLSQLAAAPSGVSVINGFGQNDYVFKNFMKQLASTQAFGGTYAWPAILDTNGYPVSTPSTTYAGAVQLPNNYTGNWMIYGTGQCDLLIQAGVTVTMVANPNGYGSASGTTLRITATAVTSWSVTFSLSGLSGYQNQTQIQFLGGAGSFSGFTNLVLCRVSAPYTGDKAAIDSGVLTQMFNDDFLNSMRALNPNILRVIDWNNPDNQGNISNFARRTPVSALTYDGSHWDPSCIATNGGSGMKTSNTGDAYSITTYPNDTGNWVDGETIQVQWSASNTTTSPTFTVGARTPKTVQTLAAAAVSAGTLANNALGTLIYDATLGVLLYNANGIAGNAVPYEVSCALANVLNKNLRETIPTHFDSASVTSWAKTFRDNLNSNLSFYCSYSNEIWNFAFGFEQTSWANALGLAFGFPNSSGRPYFGFYSLKIAQYMPLVATAWTAARPRSSLKCILELQAFGPTSDTKSYRFNSADCAPSGIHTGTGNATYNTYTGSADFTQFPNRAIDVCDYISYATYWSGAQCANADGNYSNTGGTGLTTGHPSSGPGSAINGLTGAADAYAAGGATNIANAIGWLDWDFSLGTNNGSAGFQTTSVLLANIYPAWETVAASYDGSRPSGYSNVGIICYEGGLEAVAPSTAECTTLGISTTYGGSGGKIDNLLTGYKTSSTFTARVTQQFTDFMGISPGRGSNHSIAPAWYQFPGPSGDVSGGFPFNPWAMEITDLYGGFFTSYNGFASFT
jgi:hypothetical protein